VVAFTSSRPVCSNDSVYKAKSLLVLLMLLLIPADPSSRAVFCGLRALEQRDLGFESRSWRGCTSVCCAILCR